MSDSRTPPHRRVIVRRALARTALVLASLAVALSIGEFAARAAASAAGRAHDPEAAKLALWEIAVGMSADLNDGKVVLHGGQGSSRVVLHPYLGFDAENGLEQYAAAVSEFRGEGARAAFDVVVLGGSVASIVAYQAEAALVAALREDARLAGREVRVHVYSRGAFKQPQQALMLTYLLNLGIEPDAVLNIDGYNEVSIGASNSGAHPIQPLTSYFGSVVAGAAVQDADTLALRDRAMALTLRGRRFVRKFVELGLQRSALSTWAAASFLRHNRARMVAAQEQYVQRLTLGGAGEGHAPIQAVFGPRLPEDASLLSEAVRTWSESSRILRAICEAHDIPYAHVLQPTLHDQGSKPLTEQELATGTLVEGMRVAVRDGYPLLRERGRELAAGGERFVDASRLFAEVPETLYYDACHFAAPGTDMLAREAARALIAALP